MKDKIKNIILLAPSVVIFLILFELVLHLPLNINQEHFDFWMYPYRIFYLDGNESRVYFDIIKEVDFNKIDIKTIHHHPNLSYYCDNKKKHKRILFLGDSVSIGDGVENKKKIFAYLLKEKLNNISENKIEIINYAITGYNLLDQKILLETDGIKCKPDLIIYPYYQNDLYSQTYYVPFMIPYLKYRYSKNPVHHLRIYYFFTYKWTKLRFNFLKNKFDYKDATNILNEMIKISKKSNISFYLIDFPNIEKDYPTDGFIEQYSNEKGIEYLDIRKELKKRGLDYLTLRASPVDIAHYNYYGHRIIADILYLDLLEKDLIPK